MYAYCTPSHMEVWWDSNTLITHYRANNGEHSGTAIIRIIWTKKEKTPFSQVGLMESILLYLYMITLRWPLSKTLFFRGAQQLQTNTCTDITRKQIKTDLLLNCCDADFSVRLYGSQSSLGLEYGVAEEPVLVKNLWFAVKPQWWNWLRVELCQWTDGWMGPSKWQ